SSAAMAIDCGGRAWARSPRGSVARTPRIGMRLEPDPVSAPAKVARIAGRRPRLLYLVTSPITAKILLAGQLTYLREAGFEVMLASSPGSDLDIVAERERVDVFPVPIERDIRLGKDARSLASIAALIRRVKPDIVNASTPKAG